MLLIELAGYNSTKDKNQQPVNKKKRKKKARDTHDSVRKKSSSSLSSTLKGITNQQ